MALRIAYQYWYLKQKAEIIAHKKLTPDIYEVSLKLPGSIPYQEGQFMYLQDRRGWESHPFTILTYDNETQVMKITYKVYGQFTQAMSGLRSWQHMYLDGPYGVFMDEVQQSTQPIVCIAAGIGITPFYHIIQNYSTTKDIKLVYLNKTKEDIVYEQELESQLADDSCFHILSREQEKQKHNQIVDTRITKEIIQNKLWDLLWSAQFYLCGGGAVIKEVSSMLLDLWVPPSHIDYEPFTM